MSNDYYSKRDKDAQFVEGVQRKFERLRDQRVQVGFGPGEPQPQDLSAAVNVCRKYGLLRLALSEEKAKVRRLENQLELERAKEPYALCWVDEAARVIERQMDGSWKDTGTIVGGDLIEPMMDMLNKRGKGEGEGGDGA